MYQILLNCYSSRKLSKEGLRNAVIKGAITQQQMNDIIFEVDKNISDIETEEN